MNLTRLNRYFHRWGSIIIAVPVLVILITGILLLLKKEISYLQPSTATGSKINQPQLSFEKILFISQRVKQANIKSWQDINRLDIRPSKGIIKVRAQNKWEIQLDANTGEILNVAYRRSDIIEALHDFSYWQNKANLWFTLPIAIVLLSLVITGIILFFIPYYRRYKNKQRNLTLE